MIRYILLTLLGMIIVASLAFILVNFTSGFAFSNNSKMTSQSRNVSNFNSIDFTGFGNVKLIQGNNESLIVEGNESNLNRLKTEVVDNELKIYFDNNKIPFLFFLNNNNQLKFTITFKDLNKIKVSGAVDIQSEKLNLNNLSTDINGAGKVNLFLNLTKLNVNMSGAGQLEITGKADSQEVSLSGAGKYSSRDFQTNSTKIDISGAGVAEVNSISVLNIKLSGAGKVSYVGNPTITKEISGFGKVEKLD